MPADSVADLRQKICELPAMPSVAAAAARLAVEAKPDLLKLVRCIECDPGLTANLLRIVNTGYASERPVRTVREAAMKLGAQKIQNIAVGVCISPLTHREVKGYDTTTGTLFTHSLAVAAATEELARALGREAPGYAFTAALLHDLGKVALAACAPVEAKVISAYALRHSVSFTRAEHSVLGLDHAEAGAVLLEAWHMPPQVVEVTRWHHEPSLCTTANAVVPLVYYANHFCALHGLGGDTGRAFLFEPDSAVSLPLTPAQRKAVAERVAKRLDEWRKVTA